MAGNLGDYMLVPDYLRNRYMELLDWFDKEWEPWFMRMMPKVVAPGRGSHKYWRRDRGADPQGMAKFYNHDEAVEPMNYPSVRPWNYSTRMLGNALTRRKTMFKEDFADGIIDKAHAEMMENLTKFINRSIEYTLCQFMYGNTTVMAHFTDQDLNRQGICDLNTGNFNGVAASELGGTTWDDFSGGTPAVFSDLAFLKERYKYLAGRNPEYMMIGRKSEYNLEINDDLLDRLIRLKDTTNGVLGDYLMGLQLIKVVGQTYKDIPGANALAEGMPGVGEYLEMDWTNLNRKDMMIHQIAGNDYEWSIIGVGDVGEVKCAFVDEDHRDERGTPTEIFIEQWEERNPKTVWTSAKLEVCPEIKDYAKVLLVKAVAQQT